MESAITNQPAAPRISSAPDNALVFDYKRALNQACGDEELLTELFELFFDDWSKHYENFLDALVREDRKALQQLAHQVKGAVSNFYAEQARQAAANIEEEASGK